MTKKSKKNSITFAALIMLVVGMGLALFSPVQSRNYSRNIEGLTQSSISQIKVERSLLLSRVYVDNIMHGACDYINFHSSMKESKKVITITAQSTSNTCTYDLRYSDADYTFLHPLWERGLIIKDSDVVVLETNE